MARKKEPQLLETNQKELLRMVYMNLTQKCMRLKIKIVLSKLKDMNTFS